MPLIDIAGDAPSNCRIPRCVEAIWIDSEQEVYLYYDILVDNSQEAQESVDRLSVYLLSDCTAEVKSKVEALFPDIHNQAFPSDLSNTFFASANMPENRFFVDFDGDARLVARRPPLGPGWEVPKSLTITSSLIGNYVRPARGTLVNIAINPPILPGHKANLRMIFKRGDSSISQLIRSYRKHWTGTLVNNLVIRSFDYETLTGSGVWIENRLPVDDYRLLVVLPPESDNTSFSVPPDSILFHEFHMLSDEHGPSRLSFEWRRRPETERPLRIQGKYTEDKAHNWEFTVLIAAAIAGFVSLAIDLYQLFKAAP